MKTQYTNVYRSRPKYKKGELVTKKKTKKKNLKQPTFIPQGNRTKNKLNTKLAKGRKS